MSATGEMANRILDCEDAPIKNRPACWDCGANTVELHRTDDGGVYCATCHTEWYCEGCDATATPSEHDASRCENCYDNACERASERACGEPSGDGGQSYRAALRDAGRL